MSETRGEPVPRKPANRSDDLLGRKDSKLRKELQKVWNDIKRGFENQGVRADRIKDNSDAYNTKLNDNQYYNGESETYIPNILDAVDARATRYSNQLCPKAGRYVEALSTDGSRAEAITSLLDEYLKDFPASVVWPMLVNGDIEGQYNLYVDWSEVRREVVSREIRGPTVTFGGQEMPIPGEEVEDIVVEEIIEQRPITEVLHDTDILVLPPTADTIEEALAAGGLVAIVRRWSKGKIEKLRDAGHIREEEAKQLLDAMGTANKGEGVPSDKEKLLAEVCGIYKKGTEATVWECWKMLSLKDGRYSEKGDDRLCRIFFGPDQMALGAVRNPHWNDRCPLISRPVKKIAGVFKGKPPVDAVISLQYAANDAVNEGEDMSHYSAMPVVMRHPQAGSQPLVMNVGAVWDIDPNMVKIMEYPDMTDRAVKRIGYAKQQTFETLSVNPSMLPMQTSATRRNQAQIAQEQAIDLLTVAQAIIVPEDMLTDVVAWYVDLDYQYRDREQTVKMHGKAGIEVNMQAIPPFKTRAYYRFRWWGADQARFNAAMFQQIAAWMNVVSSPQMTEQLKTEGKRINFVPIIEMSAAALLGPKYGPLVVVDERANLSLDPKIENQLLAQGHDVPISPFDQHQQHIATHQQDIQENGDLHGNRRMHVQRHLIAAAMQQQAGMAMASQQAMAGNMQGQRPPPRGTQPGAQPGGPRSARLPGAIHPEAMPAAGGIMMPRKF